MTKISFVIAMCLAEVLGMLSFSTFQALIPTFQMKWNLSNTDAGWISGIYFAGYVGAVPVLSSLTDRIDPKKVLLFSLTLGGGASLAFAFFADGFWSAFFLRSLHGIGLAGTYMPGLKALSDQTEGPNQSRYVSLYTASFGIGAGLSFLLAGIIEPSLGWAWAFGVNTIGTILAAVLILKILPWKKPPKILSQHHLLDFRPVLKNRSAMRYILGYCGHNWELFGFRSWVVAFLVFAMSLKSGNGFGFDATVIAAVATLLGVPSSVFGNELAIRFGRRRIIIVILIFSVLVSLITGAAAGVSYGLVVCLCLIYGVLLTGDSGAITAGTVAASEPGARGATLAMHAMIGFVGGILGPLCVGVVLDAAGDTSVLGWALAFAVMGAGSVAALVAISFIARNTYDPN
ncbi:MAG: MFS transporter [Pseudomonadota bacterium]|nr:MFS transporter [Pseudomonadota bacterium]